MEVAKPENLCEITDGFCISGDFEKQDAARVIVVWLKLAHFDRLGNVIDRVFCIALL